MLDNIKYFDLKEELMDTQVLLGLLALVIMSLLVYEVITAKKRKAKKDAKLRAKEQDMLSKDIMISGKHITGLPIAEGVLCNVKYLADRIEIIQGGNTFNLNLSKITDITTTTDKEIQKQYVSSVGGAVGGAVLFGPLGAMIGGRVKEKNNTIITNYLIITYMDDDQVKYISFEYNFSMDVMMFIKKFVASNSKKNVINL